MAYDLYDRQTSRFLTTQAVRQRAPSPPFYHVPLVQEAFRGTLEALTDLAGRSRVDSASQMEGLYVRRESDGQVVRRAKWVREGFRPGVEGNWRNRAMETNRLATG